MAHRVHWIEAEPYGWPVLVYVGSWAQFRAYLKCRNSVDVGEQQFGGGYHARMYCAETCDAYSAIWLPKPPLATLEGLRVLSHELLHAAFGILDRVGVPMGFEHQEALCYLHEGLNRLAHRALNA